MTAIEDAARSPDVMSNLYLRRVHLRVSETFVGAHASEIDIYTGLGGGDCGYPFVTDGTYLIYTYKIPDGRLTTGTCSLTKPLSNAASDLTYLRALQSNTATQARIFGKVTAWDNVEATGAQTTRMPYAGATITAKGASGTFKGLSDSEGSYEITAPVGEYEVAAAVEPGRYATVNWPRVKLTDPRGCSQNDVSVRSDGRISGRVVDSTGAPIANLSIEIGALASLNQRYYSPDHQSKTSTDGTFIVNHLSPGEYVVGTHTRSGLPYPRVLYSRATSQADAVSVSAGEEVPIGDFVIPAGNEIVQLKGVVKRDDGQSVSGSKVYLEKDSRDLAIIGEPTVVGPDGSFSFAAFSGYTYRVVAELVVPASTSSGQRLIRSDIQTAAAGRDPAPLVLMLKSGR